MDQLIFVAFEGSNQRVWQFLLDEVRNNGQVLVLLLGPALEEVEELRHENVPILEDLSFFDLAGSDLVDEVAEHKIELLQCVDFFLLEVVDDHKGRADHDAVGQ